MTSAGFAKTSSCQRLRKSKISSTRTVNNTLTGCQLWQRHQLHCNHDVPSTASNINAAAILKSRKKQARQPLAESKVQQAKVSLPSVVWHQHRVAGNLWHHHSRSAHLQLPSTAVSLSQLRRHIAQNVLKQRQPKLGMLAALIKVGMLGTAPDRELSHSAATN